ncbi:MAG: CT583 family protein [Rhabdochlamydiaceae bacterium]|nr:CT583 family protein [Candidatus Amphrikana amoebophyrae]
MSKNSNLVANFLQRSSKQTLPPKPTKIANSFEQMFGFKELSKDEKSRLEKLLLGELLDDEGVDFKADFEQIASVSAQVRAIQKQGILLIGERIHQARQILSKYSQGKKLLTKWMSFSFSSLKTAYNALAYHDLYHKIPTDELKEKYKAMPAKASYVLASRAGEVKAKLEVIDNHKGKFAEELIEEIRTIFPLNDEDKRAKKEGVDLEVLAYVKKIRSLLNKGSISAKTKKEIKGLLSELKKN